MARNTGKEATAIASVPEEVTGQPRRVVLGPRILGNTFASLRHRNFRLFFAGQLVSLIGTWMQNTAQGWLVYQLTGSKLLLGVVAAVGSTPMMLFSIWGGSVADRHSKRRIILYTQTGMLLLAFVFAGLVWSGLIRPWHILVLAALGGLAMAFDMPARQAFMVEMTNREDLINAISLNSSIVNGARVVGPSLAGFLMARVGIEMCFFLNGLSFLAVIAGLWMMRLPRFIPPARPSSAWAHVVEGFAYVWQHSRMRTILILFAIVGIFGWSYSVLMPAFARDVLHVGQTGYGVLLSANGIGALLGALTVATIGNQGNRRFLGLDKQLCSRLGLPRHCRMGNGCVLFEPQHAPAGECFRRDAGARYGDLGVGIRRHDTDRRVGGGDAIALRRPALGRNTRGDDLCIGGPGGLAHSPAAHRFESRSSETMIAAAVTARFWTAPVLWRSAVRCCPLESARGLAPSKTL